MKKFIKYCLAMMFFMTVGVVGVNAGSINISASSKSVTVGGSVNITVSPSDVVGRVQVVSSNNNVLSGGTSSVWIEDSVSYKFSAKNEGTATISVIPVDAADSSGEYTKISSITITVVAKKVVILSTNNDLASLSVDGVELEPLFDTDTLEYSISLEPGTEKVNINASAADLSASISGAGEREVSEGENRLEIVVTAENGSTKTYVINANVKEYNPIEVKINDDTYNVVRKASLLVKPDEYEETTIVINDEEVPALKGTITGYILVGLKDSEGNINLYVYDKSKNSYNLYKEHTFNNVILYPLELSEEDIPKGYKKTTINYNDQKIVAYKLDKNSKYALIYGMNVETGKTNLYMYDSKEDTLQIYNTEEIKFLKSENDKYVKLLIASLVVVFILVISLFVVVSKLMRYKELKKLISPKENKNPDKITVKEVKIKKRKRSKEEPKEESENKLDSNK